MSVIIPFFQSSYNRFDIADSDPDMAIDGFYADLEPLMQLAYNSIDGISADRGQSSKFKYSMSMNLLDSANFFLE